MEKNSQTGPIRKEVSQENLNKVEYSVSKQKGVYASPLNDIDNSSWMLYISPYDSRTGRHNGIDG
jgi:hypothetical protein